LTRRNVLIAPLVLLVRAPVMLFGMLLISVGTGICRLGEVIPGFDR
jgi:hypothetical protein